jgi:hypothetical protein
MAVAEIGTLDASLRRWMEGDHENSAEICRAVNGRQPRVGKCSADRECSELASETELQFNHDRLPWCWNCYANFASMVMVALSTLDTGQPALALAARS